MGHALSGLIRGGSRVGSCDHAYGIYWHVRVHRSRAGCIYYLADEPGASASGERQDRFGAARDPHRDPRPALGLFVAEEVAFDDLVNDRAEAVGIGFGCVDDLLELRAIAEANGG